MVTNAQTENFIVDFAIFLIAIAFSYLVTMIIENIKLIFYVLLLHKGVTKMLLPQNITLKCCCIFSKSSKSRTFLLSHDAFKADLFCAQVIVIQ